MVDYVLATPEFEHWIMAPREDWNELASAGIDSTRTIEYPNGVTAAARAINAAVKRLDPMLVMAHSSWAGVAARIRRLDAPVAYQPHGIAFLVGNRPRLVRFAAWCIERTLAPRTAIFVALSEHEASEIRRLVRRRPVLRVVNVSRAIASDMDERHIGSYIATVGRICPQKDPLYFVSIARRLPRSQFVWVGDGSRKLRLALEAEPNVTVTGWLSREDTWNTMARASAYIHTAESEGFPLTLLDAAALGIPVVARRIAPIAETSFVNLESSDEIAVYLDRLNSDARTLEANLDACRQALSDYSLSNQRRQLLDLFGRFA